MAIKPFPKQAVTILDEVFHLNNNYYHLTNAYHKMPTASLKFILSKVRQELIINFQKLYKRTIIHQQEVDKFDLLKKELSNNSKKIFVTYSWESADFNQKVIDFVNFLREKGFDASIDRKRSQDETSINLNQMMLDGIQNSDKVIVILSESYKRKADNFKGGVNFEYQIILEEIKKYKTKPVVHLGDIDFEVVDVSV